MKKLTLQWRITLLTAVILIIASIALTAFSMFNAQLEFFPLLDGRYVTAESAAVSPATPAESVVGIEATPAVQAKRQFDTKSILFCVFITVAGTCAVYYTVGRALKPLRALSAELETIDEENLSARLPKAATQDEVGRLTDNFNQMLSRLEDAFLRQKRFTANAAHELKTPLATLKTGAQVLSADKNASLGDYRTYAQKNLTTVNRLTTIVDDLLLLASAGEGWHHEQEEVYLAPLFEAIQSELSGQLEMRSISFSFQCGELFIMGNDSLLYRAFFNLVENACKYGYKNGHIWAEAYWENGCICVRVKDDGPGIPAEHLPYIFDAFYRVDKSRSREMGGSGLGLSLVKTMIEAEGGSIAVASDGTHGTCFSVVFPG